MASLEKKAAAILAMTGSGTGSGECAIEVTWCLAERHWWEAVEYE